MHSTPFVRVLSRFFHAMSDILPARALALLCALAVVPLGRAQVDPHLARPGVTQKPREHLSNFDVRANAKPAGASTLAAQTQANDAAVSALNRAVPGVQVDRDANIDGPSFIRSTRGFLTAAPPGSGVARTTPAAADPQTVAKTFIDANAALFGHRSDVLSSARVVRDAVT